MGLVAVGILKVRRLVEGIIIKGRCEKLYIIEAFTPDVSFWMETISLFVNIRPDKCSEFLKNCH